MAAPKPEKPSGKESAPVVADAELLKEAGDQPKFSPEEEASLVTESNSHKTAANDLFSKAKYEAAIAKYDEAVAVCPNYLDYELAVLQSNISACYLKLEEWKDAIKSATAAIDCLDRLDIQETEREKEEAAAKLEEEAVEDEIVSAGAQTAGPPLPKEEDASEAARRKRREDILRIRAKALMRRARARSEAGGWSTLAGAEEDYKALAGMTNLSPADRKIVQAQLRSLPARTKAAQEKETAEMWGKLKELGNGILKPFGLSTENFQMVKDEKSGGYSMNFKQGDQE
ncbi:Tetratricopeptide repeat protein 1 [Pleurostoma richardsiae]|uniref:Tetratricopeptide repeat protein 1 n=1 Tax=Pleurostoma richardsiae TaxID=41990 RepID=A0AA38VDY6_9PEZI|nr:Tetratricopeptide repeat protein 1 [Pleurostoma richardsiae]